MKIKRVFVTLFLLVAISVIPIAPEVSAAGNAVVSVDCQDSVSTGGNILVTIAITSVSNLNAAQFDIIFDPSLLSIENISDGRINDTSFPTNSNIISTGHYRILGSKGLGTINGEGYLAVINFYAQGAGSSSIQLTNGILSGLSGEIAATWGNTTITVIGDAQSNDTTSSTSTSTSSSTTSNPSTTTSTPAQTSTADQTPATSDPSTETSDQPSQTTSTDTLDPAATTNDTANNEGISSSTADDAASPEMNDHTESNTAASVNPENETDGSPTPNSAEDTEEKDIKWPILWGIIGGALCVTGLVIFAQVKKRKFYY